MKLSGIIWPSAQFMKTQLSSLNPEIAGDRFCTVVFDNVHFVSTIFDHPWISVEMTLHCSSCDYFHFVNHASRVFPALASCLSGILPLSVLERIHHG